MILYVKGWDSDISQVSNLSVNHKNREIKVDMISLNIIIYQ